MGAHMPRGAPPSWPPPPCRRRRASPPPPTAPYLAAPAPDNTIGTCDPRRTERDPQFVTQHERAIVRERTPAQAGRSRDPRSAGSPPRRASAAPAPGRMCRAPPKDFGGDQVGSLAGVKVEEEGVGLRSIELQADAVEDRVAARRARASRSGRRPPPRTHPRAPCASTRTRRRAGCGSATIASAKSAWAPPTADAPSNKQDREQLRRRLVLRHRAKAD